MIVALGAPAEQLVAGGASLITFVLVIAYALALRRTKGLEAWKETANAASVGRAEASALADERARALERERELVKTLQAERDDERKKTDLTPLMEKVIEVLSAGQANETRAETRHAEMMVLLGQVAQNTFHERADGPVSS